MDEEDERPTVKPIANAQSAPWHVPISGSDYDKIRRGFQPREMEDRWFIRTDRPDDRGESVVHICRSWSHEEQVSLVVTAGGQGGAAESATATAIAITAIKWDEHRDEDEAKETATNLCRNLLGVHLG